ncbi:MAG: protein ImuA [Lysobacterales bacterium]|jgi:protein ImuA
MTIVLPAMPDVWRGHQINRNIPVLASGHARLDRHLPGGGWPLGALTELLTETSGNGEFSLLLPTLAMMTSKRRWVMLIDPPWVPYPPAMHGHGVALDRVMLIRTRTVKESLWASEQALRGVRGGAVLFWQEDPGFARLRRLQLAAKAGHKAAFLFRPMTSSQQASPAALRLQVRAHEADINISILKCRGKRTSKQIRIRRSQQLPGFAALSKAIAESKSQSPASPPSRLEDPHIENHTH